MSKERPDLAVEFRIGKTGVVEREQREQAAKLAEVMAEREAAKDRWMGKLSVEFRHGEVTPATTRQEADARMREIRSEVTAASDVDPTVPAYTGFSHGAAHVSPQDNELYGTQLATFSSSNRHESPETPADLPPVTNLFSGK